VRDIYKVMVKMINFTVFMVTFAMGVFLVYTLEPTKKQVWIYASPKNEQEVQYKNNAQKCFRPEIKPSECTLFAKDVDKGETYFDLGFM